MNGIKIDGHQFLQFLNAVIAASDHDRAAVAFKRALESDVEVVAEAVSKITAIGDMSSLRDYIKSRPSRVTLLNKLVEKMFPAEPDSDELSVDANNVINEMMSAYSYDGETDDFYYDQGDDSDGH